MYCRWMWRTTLIQILLLLPLLCPAPVSIQPDIQPEVCGMTSTKPRVAACSGDINQGADAWPPATIYHSSMQGYLSFPAHGFPSISKRTRDLTAFVIGVGKYTSDMFQTVTPSSFHMWNNTRDGEFNAKVHPEFTVSLQVGSGECLLTGMSLFRPTVSDLSLRLSYDSCSGIDSGIKHVAVVLKVARSSRNGASGLYHFMCRLMPPDVCDAVPLGGKGAVDIDQFMMYRPMGMGSCKHNGGSSTTSHASSISECARECATKNSNVIRHSGGSNCSGFEYGGNKNDNGAMCKVIMNAAVWEKEKDVAIDSGVFCYKVSGVSGRSQGHAPPKVIAARPVEILNLIGDLGFEPVAAVRERFAPQASECYEPFDWVRVTSPTEVAALQGRRLSVDYKGSKRVPAELPLMASVFDRLLLSLPIVAPAKLSIDSIVYADQVCVAALQNGACIYDESGLPVDLSTNTFANGSLKIILTATVSGFFGIVCTIFFFLHFNTSGASTGPAYAGYQPVAMTSPATEEAPNNYATPQLFHHTAHHETHKATTILGATVNAARLSACRPWGWWLCVVAVGFGIISLAVVTVSSGKNYSCPDIEV